MRMDFRGGRDRGKPRPRTSTEHGCGGEVKWRGAVAISSPEDPTPTVETLWSPDVPAIGHVQPSGVGTTTWSSIKYQLEAASSGTTSFCSMTTA